MALELPLNGSEIGFNFASDFDVLNQIFEHKYFKPFLLVWTICSLAFLLFYANSEYRVNLSAPPELISKISIQELSRQDLNVLRSKWPQIREDLKDLVGLFQILKLSQPAQPVTLELTSLEPLEFKVEPHKIKMGIAFAAAPGQLAHAILQSWILSRATPAQSHDLLTRILYADFFWSIAHSKFSLGLAYGQNTLSAPQNLKPKDFLFEIASYKHFALSDWLPQELWKARFSQTRTDLDPLSLRKILLSKILQNYENQNLNERIEMPRRIGENLWTESTYRDAPSVQRIPEFMNQVLSCFGFQKSFPSRLSVSLYFASPNLLNNGAPTESSYVVEKMLFPGEISLSQNDLKELHFLVQLKSVKKLSEVTQRTASEVSVDKWVEIENSEKFVHFDALKDLDFEKFAKQNREIYFAVFDEASLRYAEKKHLQSDLTLMLEAHQQKVASTLLGEMIWDASSQTFRSKSALEALQVWRPTFNESDRSRR